MDVGVRELKENLSAYLDRAAAGEVIRVTDRGRPRAILAPLPGVSRLEDGITAGWVRRGSGHPPKPVTRQRPAVSTADSLGEDRGA